MALHIAGPASDYLTGQHILIDGGGLNLFVGGTSRMTSPLFEPLAVGPVQLSNRIVFGPHGTRLQDGNRPSERHVAYHGARARGGAGLVILEVVHATPRKPPESGPYISPYLPETVDGWCRIVDEVHSHGAKIFQQVAAPGLRPFGTASRDLSPLLGPSAVPLAPGAEVPRAMTPVEINHLIESFALTAAKVREAGFDGIEIHAAHGYHLHLWLSAEYNQRDDGYGGSPTDRCRLPLEVAQAVREAVGAGMAVGMRISSNDYTPRGQTIDDAVAVAMALDRSGLIDYISVTNGFATNLNQVIPSMYQPRGVHLREAKRMTDAVRVPTMARGRIVTPQQAEDVLTSGTADLVLMVRALIADPEFANKARERRAERVRTCVGANECFARNMTYVPIGCIYNPEAGNEIRGVSRPAAAESRSVLVIGGGPGGCETARIAAERGHRVTLLEQTDALGGALRIACKAAGRTELAGIVEFYERELALLGVDVQLGTTATRDLVASADADVVVVASGAQPLAVPADVAGAGLRTRQPAAALDDGFDPGERVIVYVESHHVAGLSVAVHWAGTGRQVEVFTPHEATGAALDWATKEAILTRLSGHGVAVQTAHRLISGDTETVEFAHVLTGDKSVRPYDTLIADLGVVPDRELEHALSGYAGRVEYVGDCVSPRGVMGATHDGAAVASQI